MWRHLVGPTGGGMKTLPRPQIAIIIVIYLFLLPAVNLPGKYYFIFSIFIFLFFKLYSEAKIAVPQS